MQLIPSDPNIETLVSRIKKKEINLQPDFQRGEVWSYQKKQRLIDTILRKWHIPPIHLVIVEEDGSREVLDGQQRLVSIRDFVKGDVKINGKQQPMDPFIESLDGLTYDQLPPRVRREFDDYSIRVFSVSDYKPDEPGELFYRLNQTTSLTAAEQRNAFYGPVRNQIKELVKFASDHEVNAALLGFSNSRMAYDDVFSRLAITIEANSILEKITSSKITEYYRADKPLEKSTIERIQGSLLLLTAIKKYLNEPMRFNRATLYTWLCFFIQLRMPYQNPSHPKIAILAKFMEDFEKARMKAKKGTISKQIDLTTYGFSLSQENIYRIMVIYNDRASSRIYDVSSVILRDILTWVAFAYHDVSKNKGLLGEYQQLAGIQLFIKKLSEVQEAEDFSIEKLAEEMNWGRNI